MKKVFIVILAVFIVSLTIGLASCSSCSGNSSGDSVKVDSIKTDSVIETVEINVEHAIAQDRQELYSKLEGKEYSWFETSIVLVNFMDSDSASAEIERLTNLFQWGETDEKRTDIFSIKSIWENNGKHYFVKPSEFRLGYANLSEEAIKLTFEEAFTKMMESNTIKPHSKVCSLSKSAGTDGNPQYIFGDDNDDVRVYVDAVTGEVTTDIIDNPGKPLGE